MVPGSGSVSAPSDRLPATPSPEKRHESLPVLDHLLRPGRLCSFRRNLQRRHEYIHLRHRLPAPGGAGTIARKSGWRTFTLLIAPRPSYTNHRNNVKERTSEPATVAVARRPSCLTRCLRCVAEPVHASMTSNPSRSTHSLLHVTVSKISTLKAGLSVEPLPQVFIGRFGAPKTHIARSRSIPQSTPPGAIFTGLTDQRPHIGNAEGGMTGTAVITDGEAGSKAFGTA